MNFFGKKAGKLLGNAMKGKTRPQATGEKRKDTNDSFLEANLSKSTFTLTLKDLIPPQQDRQSDPGKPQLQGNQQHDFFQQ